MEAAQRLTREAPPQPAERRDQERGASARPARASGRATWRPPLRKSPPPATLQARNQSRIRLSRFTWAMDRKTRTPPASTGGAVSAQGLGSAATQTGVHKRGQEGSTQRRLPGAAGLYNFWRCPEWVQVPPSSSPHTCLVSRSIFF
ncbi:metabotropic glutamate receptor 8 [Platysternon megacephalum]|uniref:Metabotropic glutamate receptor 8 n=1 Tax=Platysternon megacephalum TaxID=55544 RepID=A0A4D9DM10_9SAUR|nr:metabotropic glutamate receptor 8 [Platysternon megacephalum]